MASLPYVKGVRTRYRNTLTEKIDYCAEIISSNLDESDIERLITNSEKCIKMLKMSGDKLELQSEKLACAMAEAQPENSKELERVADEDMKLCSEASDSVMELEAFVEKMVILKKKSDTDQADGKLTPSENERLVTVQEQMKDMMNIQIHHQQEFMAYVEKRDKEKRTESSVKLPKLDLNMFYGNKLHWCEFWDAFECTIHRNEKLSDIEKFSYLQSKIGGDAKRAIAGLARSGANYKVAVKLLQERFGKTQEIIDIHYKEMLSIQAPSYKVESLRSFMDTIEKHLRSLEVLGENVNQLLFVSMITTKIPEGVLRQLEISKGADVEWDVKSLRTHLRNYICACEKSNKNIKENYVSKEREFNIQRSGSRSNIPLNTPRAAYGNSQTIINPRSSSSFVTNDKGARVNTQSRQLTPSCHFCDNSHWSDECPHYKTIPERKQKIRGHFIGV